MIYGVFHGIYSDWDAIGYFTDRELADKYCALHDCYVIELENLDNKEDLSKVKVFYQHYIVFDIENNRYVMQTGLTNYNVYTAEEKRKNSVEMRGWGWKPHILFTINTDKPDDRKRCEKIAQDYLAQLKIEDGIVTKESVNALNEYFNGTLCGVVDGKEESDTEN